MQIYSRFYSILLVLGFGLGPMASAKEPGAQQKDRSRLEELFVWQTSEELKLNPEQEQKYSNIIRDFGTKKRTAAEELEAVVRSLSQQKTPVEREKALKRHRELLKKYHAVQVQELDQLKSLLGSEKFAKYLVLRGEISDKLKTLLAAPPAVENKAISSGAKPEMAPKIIEEK